MQVLSKYAQTPGGPFEIIGFAIKFCTYITKPNYCIALSSFMTNSDDLILKLCAYWGLISTLHLKISTIRKNVNVVAINST